MHARDRLLLWRPPVLSEHVPALEADSIISQTIACAWQESTLRVYGGGLLHFHAFCDRLDLSESQRTPCSRDLLASFVTAMAGSYAASTISNYVAGLQAWHSIHRLPWNVDKCELTLLLRAADRLAPPSSVKPQRLPYMVDHMTALRAELSLSDPLDAAIWACLTTAFYSCARLGEFTVPSLTTFNPHVHITPNGVREDSDRTGNKVFVFHLPKTKTAPHGQDVSWAPQQGPTDPLAAMQAHLLINFPPAEAHLFSYCSDQSHSPLTKTRFLRRIAVAAQQAGLPPLHGHSIRIGSTLEYLLRGVSFEAVKLIGRWKSDAFRAYLRKHSQVLAPFLQDKPEVAQQLRLYSLPPA